MEPVGTVRFAFAATPDGPLFGDRDIYEIREEFLPLVNRTVMQVLVSGYENDYVWINVDPADINRTSWIEGFRGKNGQ